MADTKISALPASTTPLAGSEVLPVVQSSTTKQVNVSNLTAGRAVAAKNFTASDLTNGRVPVVSTSGLITDNANLLWDNGNAFMGIGISPAYRLHVSRSSAAAIAAFRASDTSAAARTIVAGNSAGDLVASVTTAGAGVIYSDSGTTLALGSNGSTTARVTVQTGGDVTVNTGNLIQGTAAKGINFTANTPAAGMTSQLLNWYEEGTWTTTVSASTNWNATPTLSAALYTKVGRLVTIEGKFTGTPTATGSCTITFSIPFATAANSSGAVGVGAEENQAAKAIIFDPTSGSATTMYMVVDSLTGGASRTVNFSVTYCAA